MSTVFEVCGALSGLFVQDGKPVVYTEDQLKLLIEAAGQATDVNFIESLWQRLLLDTSGSSSSKDQTHRPTSSAYQTVIRALVQCDQWAQALDLVVQFENAYGDAWKGPGRDFTAVSVYHGLRFFPLALVEEGKVAALFEAVKARKDAGQPVTTTLMNIICRAIARLGNTEAAGTVLQSYGVWGIAHDADSYNAIMECCKINAKVVGAESLLSYMTSKGIKPNAATWNLLISTAIAAGDRGAVVSAIERTMAANCKVQVAVVKRAKELAHDEPPSRPALRLALNRVIEQQNLQDELRMPVNVNYHQRQQQYQLGQARESSSGVGEFRRQTKDVWRPGMQQPEEQPEQQQVKQPPVQQPQQPSEDEHSGSDEQPQMSGLRSQLRDAFKPGR
eukprot:GHUV01023845.1.p1 GENE.GHUV01023845.1~~GHUV01023845.1.p1  ORF type:complete len:390 (+),score=63.82 GHUV01023845.1:40-1209(+)